MLDLRKTLTQSIQITMKKQLLILATALLSLTAFSQVPNYVPTNGLVGYWPFNGNANDKSGNGNNGTVNGATITSDRFGNMNSSYYFSSAGCEPRIDVNINTSAVQTALTISIWMNKMGVGCSGPRLFEFYPGVDGPGMARSWEAPNSSIGIGSITSTGFAADAIIPESPIGVWSHIVYTNDGSFAKFFKDGALYTSFVVTGNPILSGNASFGRMNHPANDAYNGSLDDIGIWNRALTVCEIQDLYHSELNSLAVSGGADESICNGDQLTLTASGSQNYSWNNGVVDGAPFSPTNTLEYIVTADSAGCQSADTLTVFVNQPTNSTLNETALDSFTLNGQTYNQSGTYTQVIPNAAGCDSTITLNLSLDFTGLQELENSFTISPNPAKDQLNVLSPSGISENYFLLDGLGRTVLRGKLTGTTTTIDISKLATGNYLVQIGEEQMPVRIVKN